MNLLEWIDSKMPEASNPQKSELMFARRFVVNSGLDQDDVASLRALAAKRQVHLINAGCYSLVSRLAGASELLRGYQVYRVREELRYIGQTD